MWSLVPQRLQLLSIVACAIVIVLGIEAFVALTGGEETNPLKHAFLVVSIIGLLLTPMANLLWRHVWRWFPAIERITFPDLNGTWQGQIATTWKDPESGISPPPTEATVLIKQSLFSITVSLRTGELQSHSTRCYLEANRGAGVYRVWYSYDNRPKA